MTTATNQPLSAASVSIRLLNLESRTDAEGRYALRLVRPAAGLDSIELVARHLGYQPARVRLALDSPTVEANFTLNRDVLNLDEIVVTGTSDATSQRMTPFSVAAVDESRLKEVPAASPLGALAGKIAGLNIVTPSGEPGSAPAIRLRSPTSIVGSSDPLVIIDGSITRLSLADINSEDIERMEVLKGASATSLYGSDAAGGVIHIFTKRNAALPDGAATYTVRTEVGHNSLRQLPRGNLTHPFQLQCGASPCSTSTSTAVTGYVLNAAGRRVEEQDLISDNAYRVYHDPLRVVFRGGQFASAYASYGQRRDHSNFLASFQDQRDDGIVALKQGYRRRTVRINADQRFGARFDVGLGAFYARSTADQAEHHEIGTGLPTVFEAAQQLEPDMNIDSIAVDCPPSEPACSWVGGYPPAFTDRGIGISNPMYLLQHQQISNRRNRFSGNFMSRFRPTSWLTGEARIGFEASGQEHETFSPLGFIGRGLDISSGRLFQRTRDDRAYNSTATLTSTRNVGSRIRNTTRVAVIHEEHGQDHAAIEAARLTVPHVRGLIAADPAALTVSSRSETVRANNTFVVSTFEIDDRYVFDALVRRDESSLFGASERRKVYHRLSGAWRVSETLKLPGIDELKLRASLGTAGLRPPFAAQYEVLSIVGGLPEKNVLGNPKLRPAYSRETEYGVNVSAWRNYTAEYGYSSRRTTDQIMLAPITSRSGYRSQWQNVGTLTGSTHELALGAALLARGSSFWRVNITADRTRQRIRDLNRTAFAIGPLEGFGLIHIAPGEDYGVVYGGKFIQTRAELLETLRTGRLTGTESDYVVNEQGFYVRKAQHRTVSEVPLAFFRCGDGDAACSFSRAVRSVRLGNVNPDVTMGFNTMLQQGPVSLSGTLTWVKGGKIYNFTRRAAFFGGTFRDKVYDESDKPAPVGCPSLDIDANCPYSTGRKPVTYYHAFLGSDDFFFERATHVKLRELALNWTIPPRWLKRVSGADMSMARAGIVGRNLWTRTPYSGYDPEASSGLGGRPSGDRLDWFAYPPYRTFTFMLELTL